MANIDADINTIATGIYGADVRAAIANAITAVNNDLPNSANVSMEVVSARTQPGSGLPTANSLSARLQRDYADLKAYTDAEVVPGNNAKVQINNATVGYASLKDRLDSDYNSLNNKYRQVQGYILVCEDSGNTGNIEMSFGGN